MSDVDPTPTTPVTIKDALGWFRGDMAAKLISIEAKLDTLTTLLSTGGGIESAPIVAAINDMAGGKSISDIYGAITDLAHGYTLSDLYMMVSHINNAVGGYPQSSLELGTVRGFLSAIMNSVGKYGILPDGTMGSASTGTLTSAGRRYIVWSALSGITLSEDGRELTPDTSWSGYELYVQTDAPSFTLHDVTDPAQSIDEADVNSWITLSGTHTLSMSVDSGFQVRGYMRIPAFSYEFSSQSIYGSNRIVWPEEPPTFVRYSGAYSEITASNQFIGWTLTVISGDDVSFLYANNPSQGGAPSIILHNGIPVLFSATDAYVWTSAVAPFTLRMTPPPA